MRMKNPFLLEKNSNLKNTKMTLTRFFVLIGVCLIVITCSSRKEKMIAITEIRYNPKKGDSFGVLDYILLNHNKDTLSKKIAELYLIDHKDTSLSATYEYLYHDGRLKSIGIGLGKHPPIKEYEYDYLSDTVFVKMRGGETMKKYKDTIVYGSLGKSFYSKAVEKDNESYFVYLKKENEKGLLVNEIISQEQYNEKKQLVRRTQTEYNQKREIVEAETLDFEYEKGLLVTVNQLVLSRSEDDKPVLDSGLLVCKIRYNKQNKPVECQYSNKKGIKYVTVNYAYDRQGKLTQRKVFFTQGYTFFSQFRQLDSSCSPFEFEPINSPNYFFNSSIRSSLGLYFTEEPTVLDMSYTYLGDEISDIILKIRDTIRIHKKIRYLDKPLILH